MFAVGVGRNCLNNFLSPSLFLSERRLDIGCNTGSKSRLTQNYQKSEISIFMTQRRMGTFQGRQSGFVILPLPWDLTFVGKNLLT